MFNVVTPGDAHKQDEKGWVFPLKEDKLILKYRQKWENLRKNKWDLDSGFPSRNINSR
jgi:hypothetical protein